jgi:hypothetical protein
MRIAVPLRVGPGHDQMQDQDQDHQYHEKKQFCFLCHIALTLQRRFFLAFIYGCSFDFTA